MNKKNISKILTDGLQKGYGGKTVFKKVTRGGFGGESSHFEEEAAIYHDEWFARESGGGQELIKTPEGLYTRLYGGGVPDTKRLESLGVTSSQVGDYLKKCITEFGSRTRLFENTNVEDGDWKYTYEILEQSQDIEVIASKELITYKGIPVHIHMFILTPVR